MEISLGHKNYEKFHQVFTTFFDCKEDFFQQYISDLPSLSIQEKDIVLLGKEPTYSQIKNFSTTALCPNSDIMAFPVAHKNSKESNKITE